MDSEYRSQEQNHSKKQFTFSKATPSSYWIPNRQLSAKEEAAKDLWIITNSIMKRKFLRALEQIKLYNFDSARKEVANDNIRMGFRLEEQKNGKRRKPRTRSLDPYAQYSRSRLLNEIVSKLKAKNQGNSWQQDNTTVLYEKVKNLEKLVSNQKNNSNSEYEARHTSNLSQQNTSTEELKEAIRQIRRDVENNRLSNQRRDPIVEETSKITYVQPSFNSSVYRDLPEFAHYGTYRNSFKTNQESNDYGYENQRRNNYLPTRPDYQRVRSFVSPEPSYKFSYRNQPQPYPQASRKFHNQYEFLGNQRKPSTNFGDYKATNSFLNNTQSNPHYIDINVSNSFENMISPQPEHEIKVDDQSSILNLNRKKSKQKIKIISQLPIKGRKSRDIEQRAKQVKKTYEIVTPSIQSNSYKLKNSNLKPMRLTSPPLGGKKIEQPSYFCDYCDRCCSCEPQP